jgi:hypothetical protein
MSSTNLFLVVVTNQVCCTNTQIIFASTTCTNSTVVTPGTDVASLSGKLTGTYKSGIKGQKAIKINVADAALTGDDFGDSPTVNLDSHNGGPNLVSLTHGTKIDINVVGSIDTAGNDDPTTGLPFVGSGSANNNSGKYTLSIKGVGAGKGSSLSLKGTSASGGDLGAVTASGKVLGQAVKTSAGSGSVQ